MAKTFTFSAVDQNSSTVLWDGFPQTTTQTWERWISKVLKLKLSVKLLRWRKRAPSCVMLNNVPDHRAYWISAEGESVLMMFYIPSDHPSCSNTHLHKRDCFAAPNGSTELNILQNYAFCWDFHADWVVLKRLTDLSMSIIIMHFNWIMPLIADWTVLDSCFMIFQHMTNHISIVDNVVYRTLHKT